MPAAGCQFRRKPFFRELPESEFAFVSELKLGSTTLPANRDVMQTGEVGGNLAVVQEGWAFRYRTWPDGKRQILDFLLPGDLIGLQSGLLGMVDHSVRALTSLKLCVVDGRAVDQLFRSRPHVALALAKHSALEERRLDIRLAVIGQRNAVERLAYLMIELFERQRRPSGAQTCPFPLRRQHIADAVGLTGAHVNRTLNVLRQRRLATVAESVLTIQDLSELLRLSGYVAPGIPGTSRQR